MPASISAAAPDTSTTCVAALAAPPGPPAKRLTPPPSAPASATVGKPGAPYWTAVKVDSTVQPGGGSCATESVAPGAASAPGLTSRFPVGTDRPRGRGGEQGDRGEPDEEVSAHAPTISRRADRKQGER